MHLNIMIWYSPAYKESVYKLIECYPYIINILTVRNKKGYIYGLNGGFNSRLRAVGYIVSASDKEICMYDIIKRL